MCSARPLDCSRSHICRIACGGMAPWHVSGYRPVVPARFLLEIDDHQSAYADRLVGGALQEQAQTRKAQDCLCSDLEDATQASRIQVQDSSEYMSTSIGSI